MASCLNRPSRCTMTSGSRGVSAQHTLCVATCRGHEWRPFFIIFKSVPSTVGGGHFLPQDISKSRLERAVCDPSCYSKYRPARCGTSRLHTDTDRLGKPHLRKDGRLKSRNIETGRTRLKFHRHVADDTACNSTSTPKDVQYRELRSIATSTSRRAITRDAADWALLKVANVGSRDVSTSALCDLVSHPSP